MADEQDPPRFKRPDTHEIIATITLILLAIFPVWVLLSTGSRMAFVFLAFALWWPIIQCLILVFRYKAWPRFNRGAHFKMNHRRD